jgi:GT2 family glycosyltransferase
LQPSAHKTPLLASVIIPSSGRTGRLEQTLRGLSLQTAQDDQWELIMIDDTLDGSLGPRASAFRGSSPLRIVQTRGSGPAAARNQGAAVAAAPLLIFLDDDCVPSPHWLAAYLEAAQVNPGAVLVGPIHNGFPGHLYAEAYHLLLGYFYRAHLRNSTRQPFFPAANFAVPRDLFLALRGFEPSLRIAEDRAFSALWRQVGNPVHPVPEAYVAHLHDLTWRDFIWQQFLYGRGAIQFRRWLRASDLMRTSGLHREMFEAPGFYLKLLQSPFADGLNWRSLLQLAIIIQAQAAVGLGAICELCLEPQL